MGQSVGDRIADNWYHPLNRIPDNRKPCRGSDVPIKPFQEPDVLLCEHSWIFECDSPWRHDVHVHHAAPRHLAASPRL